MRVRMARWSPSSVERIHASMVAARAADAAAIKLNKHMLLLRYFLCHRLIPNEPTNIRDPVRIKAAVALKHQSDSNFRSSAKSF
jgi:hypothetical protein